MPRGHYDLVLMDLEMPIMNGKEAMKLIRRWEADNGIKHCKIVVITGNCDSTELNECMDV